VNSNRILSKIIINFNLFPKFSNHIDIWNVNFITCLLRAGILKPADTAVARQYLCKHISTATSLGVHGRSYTQQRNTSRHFTSAAVMTSRDNRGIVRKGVFCWARAEDIPRESKLKPVRNPASRRRRRKENPVPEVLGITRPPCSRWI
jgi:hypothetical protein